MVYKTELVKPTRNGEYLVCSKGTRWVIAEWKNSFFDMNPNDVPYIKDKQPEFWTNLPLTIIDF